jgi:dTMP kinase
MSGIYVVFEGLDGCGKTTQSKSLVDRLNKNGRQAVWTREPGSSLVGFNVRDLVLSHQEISPRALELLFQADRAEHTSKVEKLIHRDVDVVSDRSYISGLAYALACGHDERKLRSLLDYSLQIKPNIVFLLEISPEEVERRKQSRGGSQTREETKGVEFTRAVQGNFISLIEEASQTTFWDWEHDHTRFIRIDGTLPKEEIELIVDREIFQASSRTIQQENML